MNQSKQNPKEAVDIGVYDIFKCFCFEKLDSTISVYLTVRFGLASVTVI